MTDERKEGQRCPDCNKEHLPQDYHAGDSEPRGSEALANAVLRLAKSMNQSNIWALRNEIMELCEGAAATAERTPPETMISAALLERVITKNCDWQEIARVLNLDRQPAPPQPEAPEKEKP